jgi:hypothetical protein
MIIHFGSELSTGGLPLVEFGLVDTERIYAICFTNENSVENRTPFTVRYNHHILLFEMNFHQNFNGTGRKVRVLLAARRYITH